METYIFLAAFMMMGIGILVAKMCPKPGVAIGIPTILIGALGLLPADLIPVQLNLGYLGAFVTVVCGIIGMGLSVGFREDD